MDDLEQFAEQVLQEVQAAVGASTGTQASPYEALGALWSLWGHLPRPLAEQLAQIHGYCALDAAAFYDAAAILARLARHRVQAQRRGLVDLFHGPNGLLRLSPRSRLGEDWDSRQIAALREKMQALRFIRSEITETVRADLLPTAQRAAADLADLLKQLPRRVGRPPAQERVDAWLLAFERQEADLHRVRTLSGDWTQAAWAESALRHLIETLDAQLRMDVQAELGANDQEADRMVRALARIQTLVAAVEALLAPPIPEGDLLVPRVRVTGHPYAFDTEVLLRPRPERILGRITFPARVTWSEASDLYTLETCRSAGDPFVPTWFEQGVQLALDDEAFADLVTATPMHQVVQRLAAPTPSTSADGSASKAWTTSHTVIDYTTATNWSANYATTDTVLVHFTTGVTPTPDVGSLVRFGNDLDGPRLEVLSFLDGASIAGGTWMLLELGDPLGDLPGGVTAWLAALAAAPSPPLAARQLGRLSSLNTGAPVAALGYGLGASGWWVRWVLEDDAQGLYAEVPNGGTSEVSAYGGVDRVELTTPWPAGDASYDTLWAVEAMLYRDVVDAGETQDLRLETSTWTDAERAALHQVLRRGRSIRLRRPDTAALHTTTILDVFEVDADAVDFSGLDARLPAPGAWILRVADAVADATAWIVQLPPTTAQTLSPAALTPWRGHTGLPVDLAIGDTLWCSDGQAAVVRGTWGGRALVDPPLSLDAPLEALRIRGVRPGVQVFAADGDGGLARWVVAEVNASGIAMRLLAPGGLDPFVDATPVDLDTVFMVASPGTTTDHVDVLTTEGSRIDLEDHERRFRLALQEEDSLLDANLIDVRWVLVLDGRPRSLIYLGGHRVRVPEAGLRLEGADRPATLTVRYLAEGYQVDLEVLELWVDETGGNTPVQALGGSTVTDLRTLQGLGLGDGRVLSELPQTVEMRALEAMRGELEGPVTQGGHPLYPPWGYTRYRLDRRLPPDRVELRSDLGRALATLGQDARLVVSGRPLTLAADRLTGTLTLLTGIAPGAVEGCEVRFATGDAPDPPVRIAQASAQTPDNLLLDLTFDYTVPTELSGTVSLYDSALAQAWRSLRAVETDLDNLDLWLGYVRGPARSRFAEIGARLREAGYTAQAEACLRADVPTLATIPSPGEVQNLRTEELLSALRDALGEVRDAPLAPSRGEDGDG